MCTCDQNITPAKNARVCTISFFALRPMYTRKSPDVWSKEEKLDTENSVAAQPIHNLTTNHSPSTTKAIPPKKKIAESISIVVNS